MAKTKTEFLQDVVAAYRAAGEPWPATARHIGAWAIQQGHWEAPIKNQIDQCAEEIAAAMRVESSFTSTSSVRFNASRFIDMFPSALRSFLSNFNSLSFGERLCPRFATLQAAKTAQGHSSRVFDRFWRGCLPCGLLDDAESCLIQVFA